MAADTAPMAEHVAAQRDARRARGENRRDKAGLRDVERVQGRAHREGRTNARQELAERPSRLFFPSESRMGAARRRQYSDAELDELHEGGFEDELGDARRRAGKRAVDAAGDSKPVQAVQETAGFLLGLLAWAIALAYLRQGPAGVKQWIYAKFLNQAPKKPAATPTPGTTTPRTTTPGTTTPTSPANPFPFPTAVATSSTVPLSPFPAGIPAGWG